ncbi:MAG TPA: SnoaL-like domain-containing protein [Puia sp.]|nr:SnoaL-like domain-containing protein [Puia sp.]
MTIQEVAAKMVDYCKKGDFEGAQKDLLTADAAGIEPEGANMPSVTNRDAIIEKGHQFQGMLEAVHGISVSEPVIAGEYFSIALLMDVTMKGMGRLNMDELIVYHVKDGKIDSEQYFYKVM